MGLVRNYSPIGDGTYNGVLLTNDGNVGATPSVSGASKYPHVDDPPGTYLARSVAGAVETDRADDTNYLRCPALGGVGTFVIPLLFSRFDLGSDDVSAVEFNVRIRMGSGVSATPVDVVRWNESMLTLTIIGSIATGAINTTFQNFNISWTNPPVLTTITSADAFGIRLNDLTGQIRLSRFYATIKNTVGPTVGKWRRGSNWRWCDVCGTKHPYERMRRPESPHPQAGLVVCPRCYDEPDHDTRKIMSKRVPRDEDDALY